MALETYQYSQNYILYDYSAALKSKVLLSGEHKYFTSVITGQVSPVHVIGDGSTALSGLPFIERLDIYAAANVDLEDLRITGNKVKIHNLSAATITVQTGTTGTPTTENINPKCNVEAFFDGTYWRVEDGAQIGDMKLWHKNFGAGTQSLQWGWVEMDGSTISDSESPLNGQTVEDLNGEARFFRASATSGIKQDFKTEDLYTRISHDGGTSRLYYDELSSPSWDSDYYGSLPSRTANVTARTSGVVVESLGTTDDETRPINMSVFLIMKIK